MENACKLNNDAKMTFWKYVYTILKIYECKIRYQQVEPNKTKH